MLIQLFGYFNKYDRMIFLLIASLAFGQLGGAFQVSRILAILFIPPLFTIIDINSLGISGLKNFLIFFLLFLGLSIIWTPDKTEGAKALVYYPVHICLFLEILTFSRFASNPFKSIALGWIVGFSLLSIIAFQELRYDIHLSISKTGSESYVNYGDGIVMLRRYAAGSFFNYNEFNVYICYCTPFILFLLRSVNKKVPFALLFGILIFALYIVTTNASRGSTISIVLMSVFCLWDIFRSNHDLSFFSAVLVIVAMIVVFLNYDVFFETLLLRTSRTGMLDDSSRWDVWTRAMNVLVNTVFMGCGIGGVSKALSRVSDGSSILITHNMFIELLTQSGVLIFIPFIIGLYRLVIKSVRLFDVNKRRVLIAAFITMPFYFIVNSTYLLECSMYAFFASLFVFAYVSDNNVSLPKSLNK